MEKAALSKTTSTKTSVQPTTDTPKESVNLLTEDGRTARCVVTKARIWQVQLD